MLMRPYTVRFAPTTAAYGAARAGVYDSPARARITTSGGERLLQRVIFRCCLMRDAFEAEVPARGAAEEIRDAMPASFREHSRRIIAMMRFARAALRLCARLSA